MAKGSKPLGSCERVEGPTLGHERQGKTWGLNFLAFFPTKLCVPTFEFVVLYCDSKLTMSICLLSLNGAQNATIGVVSEGKKRQTQAAKDTLQMIIRAAGAQFYPHNCAPGAVY